MKDADEVYNKLLKQFEEDRTTIKEQYDAIKGMIKDSPEKLIVLGDSLVKTSDLLLKQTSQILELVKVSSKKGKSTTEDEEDLSLTDKEKAALSEQLKQ
jgi:hypothetical protein